MATWLSLDSFVSFVFKITAVWVGPPASLLHLNTLDFFVFSSFRLLNPPLLNVLSTHKRPVILAEPQYQPSQL